jgi:hypothetical protein
MPSKVSKDYLILRQTILASLLSLGNNQTFPTLGIYTGLKPPRMEEAWRQTIQYLEIAGLDLGEPIPGLTVI